MKLDLQFEQNQQNINVPFSESGGQLNADFGETSVLHDGQNGATFIPSVSADGIISWTNDRELPNPSPVNIKGEKGDKGDSGTLFTTNETLTLENGVLRVNTAHEPEQDNTLPITAAAVASTVGNIEILLKTI